MSGNRTTELLRELRDLAADVNPSEIIDHVNITSMGWTVNKQWLYSWHAEFDRITDKLEQAIAATLWSEREKALEELVQDWQVLYEEPDYGDCVRLRKRMQELGIEVIDE